MTLLNIDELNYELMKGLVTSMGGLTAVYETSSKKAFNQYFDSLDNDMYVNVMTKVVVLIGRVIEERDDRIMLNNLNTLL